MTSFICHPEPNGFLSRGGSGLSRSGTSYGPNGSKSGNNSIHHHNTVVASVINEASRRSLNKDQEFDILISEEPDEIRLAEFGEGNGIVMQRNKKNGKPSKYLIESRIMLWGHSQITLRSYDGWVNSKNVTIGNFT